MYIPLIKPLNDIIVLVLMFIVTDFQVGKLVRVFSEPTQDSEHKIRLY